MKAIYFVFCIIISTASHASGEENELGKKFYKFQENFSETVAEGEDSATRSLRGEVESKVVKPENFKKELTTILKEIANTTGGDIVKSEVLCQEDTPENCHSYLLFEKDKENQTLCSSAVYGKQKAAFISCIGLDWFSQHEPFNRATRFLLLTPKTDLSNTPAFGMSIFENSLHETLFINKKHNFMTLGSSTVDYSIGELPVPAIMSFTLLNFLMTDREIEQPKGFDFKMVLQKKSEEDEDTGLVISQYKVASAGSIFTCYLYIYEYGDEPPMKSACYNDKGLLRMVSFFSYYSNEYIEDFYN